MTAPTLLLTGECSPAVLRRLSGHLHALLPRAERVEIPSASRRIHEENPTAVNETILAFVERHDIWRQPAPVVRAARMRRP